MRSQLLISLVVLCANLNAQSTFQIYLESDTASFSFPSGSIVESSDRAIYACGTAYPDGSTAKTRIVKISSIGEIVWDKTFSETSSDEIFPELIATADGGLLLGNDSYSYPIQENDTIEDILVRKIDADGNLMWSNVYPARNFRDMTQTKNGDILLTGTIHEAQYNVGLDVVVHKIDMNGNLIWSQQLGIPSGTLPDPWEFDEPISIISIDDYILVSGMHYSMSDFSTLNGFVYKLDQDGNEIWKISHQAPVGQDYRINSCFQFKGETYFTQNLKNFEINLATGEYILQVDSLKLNFTGKGYSYSINCSHDEITLLSQKNGIISLDNYSDPWTNSSSRELVELPNNSIAEIISISDGGFALLGDLGDSIYVTKMDCEGNISNWFADCSIPINSNYNLFIYPNPASEFTTIEANFEIIEIYIYNTNGQLIRIENTCPCKRMIVSTKNLSSGVFMLKVIGANTSEMGKLIVVD